MDLPAHFSLRAFDSLDSTNEEARRAALDGAPDGTVVWAKRQTAGRGRRGRAWTSDDGNLFCSLLLRPNVDAQKAMQLGFVTANAIADTISAVLPRHADVACKWPNDVLVENRKVSGLLMEAGPIVDGKPDWLIIGVGINAAHHPEDVEFAATDLVREGAKPADVKVEKLLVTFCRRFLSVMVTWRNLGFAEARRCWLKRAWKLGRPITVRLENQTLHGTFEALDEDGTLLLRTSQSLEKVTAGDVFPAR